MSSDERQMQADGISSVKLSTTAKGDVVPEVKVYAASNMPEDIEAAATLARKLFDELRVEYRVGALA